MMFFQTAIIFEKTKHTLPVSFCALTNFSAYTLFSLLLIILYSASSFLIVLCQKFKSDGFNYYYVWNANENFSKFTPLQLENCIPTDNKTKERETERTGRSTDSNSLLKPAGSMLQNINTNWEKKILLLNLI